MLVEYHTIRFYTPACKKPRLRDSTLFLHISSNFWKWKLLSTIRLHWKKFVKKASFSLLILATSSTARVNFMLARQEILEKYSETFSTTFIRWLSLRILPSKLEKNEKRHSEAYYRTKDVLIWCKDFHRNTCSIVKSYFLHIISYCISYWDCPIHNIYTKLIWTDG